MPLYEYQCEACTRRFEVIRKFSDPELQVCTLCGKGPVQRLMSSPAIQFKGSGWYITDYAKKSASGDGKPASGGKESGEGGSSAAESTTQKESKDSSSTPTAAKPSSSKTE